ncbi:MAG: hypothetical protein CL912_21715 [Deltaproteobacteria bacterium]|nr:hypothetical protein [Deltaproteobacteria bacterium]
MPSQSPSQASAVAYLQTTDDPKSDPAIDSNQDNKEQIGPSPAKFSISAFPFTRRNYQSGADKNQ